MLAEAYPFLVPVEDRNNEGKVIGVLCSLCMKHKTNGTWTSKPCLCIEDMIDRHSKSAKHREAIEKEMLTSATSSTALSFSSGYIPATAFLSLDNLSQGYRRLPIQ